MEFKVIETIKPVINVPQGVKVINTIYYPYMVYHIKVIIRRALGKPASLQGFVVVDLARALVLLADSFPDTLTVKVPVNLIIPERISEEKAVNLAKKKMVYVAMRKFKIMLPPKVEIVKCKKVYKQFWLIELNNKKYVIDSLTGESEEIEWGA